MFSSETFNRADGPLLCNGAVNLFSRRQNYAAAVAALDGLGYRMLIFRCGPEYFIDEMSVTVKWREHFGYEPWSGGLDAFNDTLHGEPFDTADDSAICIKNFHMLVADDEDFARGLLDIIEHQSRHYLLFGKRLIALIHTQDKSFRCEGLGGRTAMSG
jgi:hypothetical protein